MCKEESREIATVAKMPNRLQVHVMPPMGWMNDPNGLCYYKGYYHIFFQYSPDTAEGGLKCWGHYRTKDWLEWEYLGIALQPDLPEDRDGVYSGSAFTEDGMLELFYTGNVIEEGDFDYIYEGRGANVIYVSSEDGIHFSEKKVLLRNEDYPADYTCHIRDPKVWKEGDCYYMVLGGRRKCEMGDRGAVLLYHSKDKQQWKFLREVMTEENFGYMWECPDYFAVKGKDEYVLSTCPQGIKAQESKYLNGDLSGYFLTDSLTSGDQTKQWQKTDFTEWDRGFDFYAPQSFCDERGRRILIGWVGLPAPEYTNHTTMKEGWQHCLTMPREITAAAHRDAKGEEQVQLLQNPIEEWKSLRRQELEAVQLPVTVPYRAFEAELLFADGEEEKAVVLGEDLRLEYKDGLVRLLFLNDTGEGRKERRAELGGLYRLRIYKDVSMVEYFLNDGEMVFTTRYYPKDLEQTLVKAEGNVEKARIWELGRLEMKLRME